VRFRLIALIMHSGNFNGGHYKSYNMVDAERWVYCNDMQIEQILTMNLLHHVFSRSPNEVPYLLFYDSKSKILHVAIHCN
jgi:ubiquitin C-terminal hydrolase